MCGPTCAPDPDRLTGGTRPVGSGGQGGDDRMSIAGSTGRHDRSRMARTLYIDCVGGVAGDMLLAALIDAGAPLDAVAGRLPVDDVALRTEHVQRHGIGATRLVVDCAEQDTHRNLRDVRAILDSGDLPARALRRAHAAFELLADAEGAVHGVPASEVIFHEVGALDAIADICGVALALEELGVDDVVCSPVPLGRGVTTGSHGLLPVPAPATLELLRGAEICGSPVSGETVTPTGAALIRSLAAAFGPLPPMRLDAVGTGAGTRDPAEVPNVVRVLLGEVVAGGSAPLLIETNLDDMIPELLPDAMTACFDAGALDVWTVPASMKHGRPGVVLSALVDPDQERAVAEVMLRHTSTLGVRVTPVRNRWCLDRERRTVLVDGEEVGVKVGLLDGEVVNLAPEHRDCVEIARKTGRTVKSVWVAALAAAQAEHR